MEQEPTKSWTVNAFNHQTGEFVEAMNHSWDHGKEFDPSVLVREAPAMRITPSRRSRPESDFPDTVATIGDIHFPFQNDRRLELALVGLRELSPTIISLMGDNLDNANYSRFESRAEWASSTQDGIDQYAEFLGMLRADHPDARIIWHEGNHDQRLEKRIREYNEDTLGIKPAGESIAALSLRSLLKLEQLDVELEEGYPSARTIIRNQLELFHGHVTNGRGLAASKVIETALMSFNTGHTHQFGVVSRTLHRGEEETVIYGAESGTFADPNKTPSGKYAPGRSARHNWQAGIVAWMVDDDRAVPDIAPITDHGITVRGKYYRS